MEYQVLARKFRPKRFEEIVGQDHIATILQNAIKQNKIAHAYLFSGTRGVGKTTAARIFAKAIMCQNRGADGNPCGECSSCTQVDSGSSLDYLEIDGASNNSVENVRELIDNVQYLPVNGKYKVYVIDEVHMLSTSAFNALLKTLEEPPAHVVFIFATTDPHKLLDTVVSRCQRIEFKNLGPEGLKSLVLSVAAKEKITFETDEVLEAICDFGNGSGRDVLSVLELLKNYSENQRITYSALTNILGVPEKNLIQQFLLAMLAGNQTQIHQLFNQVASGPVDLIKFHQFLQKEIFAIIDSATSGGGVSEQVKKTEVTLSELIWIYEIMAKDFAWIEGSALLQQSLKLLYTKVTLRRQLLSPEQVTPLEVDVKKKLIDSSEPVQQLHQQALAQIEEEEADIEETEVEAAEDEVQIERSSEFYWPDFIQDLFQINSSLAVNLERGNLLEDAFVNDGKLTLLIGFNEDERLFYDVMNEPESKRKLKEIICQHYLVEEENVNIQLKLIENDQGNFKSKVQVDEENHQKAREEQRERLLNNAYIKSAEDIFESKVNKIILND